MNIRDVEINSRWYVQLAPGATLVELEVLEKTELTILLRNPRIHSSHNKSRYIFSEIKLVELCKDEKGTTL